MGRPPARSAGEKSTREQILDVALELFTTAGYEKTSLREIAERMNFSKAALYYHFASKDDLLLALHDRLHSISLGGLRELDLDTLTPAGWPGLLDRFIDDLVDHQLLFMFHLRNRAALEAMHEHRPHHHDEAEHEDLEQRARRLLTDPRVPVTARIRLAGALGVVMSGLLLAGEMFPEVPTEELKTELRGAVRDVLAPVAAVQGEATRRDVVTVD
jgi:AcrR family transcriptional regulator